MKPTLPWRTHNPSGWAQLVGEAGLWSLEEWGREVSGLSVMISPAPALRHAIALPAGEKLIVSAGSRWLTLRVRRVGGDCAPLGDGLMLDIGKLTELREALEKLEQALATQSERVTPG